MNRGFFGIEGWARIAVLIVGGAAVTERIGGLVDVTVSE